MAGITQALGCEAQEVVIRRAMPADAKACGRICYEAFRAIAVAHNFPPDFPDEERAIGVLSAMFSHPSFYCVVAERDGKPVGSNCLDERTPIAGLGPITVSPGTQNRTVGRQLMNALMGRAAEKGFAGVRLVQSAYHNRSLSLYTKLGFVVREPLACLQGMPPGKAPAGSGVRPAQLADVAACSELCVRVHGHDRAGELRNGIQQGSARVVERAGRITGYASAMAYFGHAVGETTEDLQALISAATELQGPGILVPTRNASLFRWCLDHGLRVVQPLTLMTVGLYNEPAGAFLPSILY